MRYADLKKNDVVDGNGICVSLWMQGCPFHCLNCHNPQTWDFDGGIEEPKEIVLKKVIDAIKENGVKRNFSLLGGEPLCDENLKDSAFIIDGVRKEFPDIEICVWTGYIVENFNENQKKLLNKIDILIDGPYVDSLRNISLKLRGSGNQRVIDVGKTIAHKKIITL